MSGQVKVMSVQVSSVQVNSDQVKSCPVSSDLVRFGQVATVQLRQDHVSSRSRLINSYQGQEMSDQIRLG